MNLSKSFKMVLQLSVFAALLISSSLATGMQTKIDDGPPPYCPTGNPRDCTALPPGLR